MEGWVQLFKQEHKLLTGFNSPMRMRQEGGGAIDKILLNWPHSKLGQYCADNMPNFGKHITRRCNIDAIIFRPDLSCLVSAAWQLHSL